MRNIDADYYGYRDEDDGVIVPLEREATKEAIAKALAQLKETENVEVNLEDEICNFNLDDDEEINFTGPKIFVSHIPKIPSLEEIQQSILERKKQELLKKYTQSSVDLEDETEEMDD